MEKRNRRVIVVIFSRCGGWPLLQTAVSFGFAVRPIPFTAAARRRSTSSVSQMWWLAPFKDRTKASREDGSERDAAECRRSARCFRASRNHGTQRDGRREWRCSPSALT